MGSRPCEFVCVWIPAQTNRAGVQLVSFICLVWAQANHARIHSDKDTDVVTGLKQKTNYGRPAWDKEFEQVRKENPTWEENLKIGLNKIDTFFLLERRGLSDV